MTSQGRSVNRCNTPQKKSKRSIEPFPSSSGIKVGKNALDCTKPMLFNAFFASLHRFWRLNGWPNLRQNFWIVCPCQYLDKNNINRSFIGSMKNKMADVKSDKTKWLTFSFFRFLIKNQDTFFNNGQRSRMVWDALMRARYDEDDPERMGECPKY